ncbi:hypothetical protein BOX15_Mlig007500g3, partial [Macrostomum lignano]
AAAAQQQQRQKHVAVVGCGVNGLCTAWQLLERGHRVTLLEQFPVPHSRGSSHGHSRITRYAYKEAEYARLMRRAFPLWSRLESLSGQRLFINCGMASLGSGAYLRNISEVLESNSMPLERLSGQSLASRFPRLAGFRDCVLDPSAGILLADRCLQALRSRVAQLGGRLRDCVRVTAIEPQPDGSVRLRLSGSGTAAAASAEELTADSVVLAAGAWRASCCRASAWSSRCGPSASPPCTGDCVEGRVLPRLAILGRKNFQHLTIRIKIFTCTDCRSSSTPAWSRSACTTGRTWTRTSERPGSSGSHTTCQS